ncbi:MAG: hypothetical protein GTO02_14125 [Candidatus Dadabacteria bacterium]|nr:hypothetical protein [Candidatus Dadabacteria bacterium]
MDREEIDLTEAYIPPKPTIPRQLREIIADLEKNENVASFDRNYYKNMLEEVLGIYLEGHI